MHTHEHDISNNEKDGFLEIDAVLSLLPFMDAIWAFEPQVFVATFRGNAANPNPRERTYLPNNVRPAKARARGRGTELS